MKLPLTSIIPPEDFDRLELDQEGLLELGQDILANGLINPITVRPEGDRYRIIAGRRRYLAHKLFTLPEIDVTIRDTDPNRDIFAQVSENLHRSNLSPIEEALLLRRLQNERALDVTALAHMVKKSETWVRQRLAALEWPPEFLDAVHEKKLSMSAAEHLSRIEDAAERTRLLQFAIDNGATAAQTFAWLQSWNLTRTTIDPQTIIVQPSPGNYQPTKLYFPCSVCQSPVELHEIQTLRACPSCAEIIRNPQTNAR